MCLRPFSELQFFKFMFFAIVILPFSSSFQSSSIFVGTCLVSAVNSISYSTAMHRIHSDAVLVCGTTPMHRNFIFFNLQFIFFILVIMSFSSSFQGSSIFVGPCLVSAENFTAMYRLCDAVLVCGTTPMHRYIYVLMHAYINFLIQFCAASSYSEHYSFSWVN